MKITKSITANLYSFFINDVISVKILNAILIQANITLVNRPLINIDSNIYSAVMINRIICITLMKLLLFLKMLLSIILTSLYNS